MKPSLTIEQTSAVGQYRICGLVEITTASSKEKEFTKSGEYNGSLDQCLQYVIDEAHRAGYMEAAKKAINAISDAL